MRISCHARYPRQPAVAASAVGLRTPATEAQRGARLFSEQPLSIQFMEVKSPDQWQDTWTPEKVMVVAFPLAKSKRKLMGHIKWLLDHRHPGRMGRPALAELESTAHYRLSRNYTIANLQTALAVYDLWRAEKVNQNGGFKFEVQF